MHNQNIINLNPTCWWKNKFLYMSITSIIGFFGQVMKILKNQINDYLSEYKKRCVLPAATRAVETASRSNILPCNSSVPNAGFLYRAPTVHTCTPSKHCRRLFILNSLFWESSNEPASCCGCETGKRHNIRSTSLSSVGTLTQSAEGASWMMCQHSYSS